MQSDTQSVSVSKATLWTGRILSAVPALLLLMDGVMKLVKPPAVVQGTIQLGYPENAIIGIGIILICSTVLYMIPRTAVLGAILLTGYLGGAIATHVRVGNPLFTHILVPIYVGLFIWGGLYFRDIRVRDLIPIRTV
jgi:DoxX-like family